MKPSIFITRPIPAVGIEKLKPHFNIFMNTEERNLPKKEIIDQIKEKDALLCLTTDPIDRDIIDSAPHLKVISNYAVGYNNIDLVAANHRRIPVCITPGVLTDATADLTWALILALTRRVVESDKFLRDGKWKGWSPTLLLGSDLNQRTLGIVGMGRIGEAVARRAVGFGMKIIYFSRNPKNLEGMRAVSSLKELLEESDIVTLHTPLSKETRYLIDAEQLSWMKRTAYLINTTRGPVVNEKALIECLKQKRIAGAGLDVFEDEPKLADGLKELDNTVLLPHLGSATVDTRNKMSLLAAENAIAIMKGEKPFGIANPEVLLPKSKL